LFTTSFYGRVSFDQYGRIAAENNLVSQYRTDRKLQIVAPISAAQMDLIYPAPDFVERTFDPQLMAESADKAILVITILGQAYMLILFILVLKHWNSPSIRSSTRSFCLIIVIGGAVLLSSNYASTSYQNDSSCLAQVWLLSIGFQLLFLPLFLKTYRVFKIFYEATKLQVKVITTENLVVSLTIAILMEIAYLLIWTFSTTINAEVLVSDTLRPASNTLYCSINLGFTWASISVKALSLLAGCYLTFRSRNLPRDFNESRYIGMSIYNMAALGAILIPILSSSSIDSTTRFVIRCFIIVLVVCSIESILLIPKFLFTSTLASTFTGAKSTGVTTMSHNQSEGALSAVSVTSNLSENHSAISHGKPNGEAANRI
jgi:hypothetical protein